MYSQAKMNFYYIHFFLFMFRLKHNGSCTKRNNWLMWNNRHCWCCIIVNYWSLRSRRNRGTTSPRSGNPVEPTELQDTNDGAVHFQGSSNTIGYLLRNPDTGVNNSKLTRIIKKMENAFNSS